MAEQKASRESQVNLPPAGDERREELKRRDDKLAEEMETKTPEAEKINPAKLKVDQELAYQIVQHNILQVSNQREGFRYKWVYTGQNGTMVTMARVDGWVLVQGDDPEAQEARWVDSTRKLGDTILMKISEEKYQLLQKRDAMVRARQQGSEVNELVTMGSKMKGVTVHTNVDPRMMKRMQQNAMARRIAGQQFDQMLRQGSVPGMEIN